MTLNITSFFKKSSFQNGAIHDNIGLISINPFERFYCVLFQYINKRFKMSDIADDTHLQNDSYSDFLATKSDNDSDFVTDLDYDSSIDFHRSTGESSESTGVNVGPPP